MLELSLIIVSLAILIIASYTDIKTLEIPDWVNYFGITAGLGIHLIFSIQQWNYWPITSSAIGLLAGYLIACLMYYTGQWGGGDAKLLMAMGALIGFEYQKFTFSTNYMINLVFMGGIWGIIWTTGKALQHKKTVWKTMRAISHQPTYRRLRIMTMINALLLIIAAMIFNQYYIELMGLALLTYLLCYLIMFVKSVELSAMHKWVTPDKLTEGDWIIHAIKVGNQEITPGKLGLEKDQLEKIRKLYAQKKIDKILVKYGIPFAPTFLIAFIVTLTTGNLILTLLTGM